MVSQIINVVANILITIGVSFFIIFVFGRSGKIDSLPSIERLIIKLALSITACGSLFNVLTGSNPQSSEIVFNVGLALIFIWGAFFHYKYFVKKDKDQQDKDKQDRYEK